MKLVAVFFVLLAAGATLATVLGLYGLATSVGAGALVLGFELVMGDDDHAPDA
jgi:hypothetical protein